jgi:tetratricopeptide (TPR) repeat protein
MTPELWARINPLFTAAVGKPPDERKAFIAEACGDDEELRRELAALVEAHAQQEAATDKVAVNIKSLIGRVQAKFSPSDIVLGRFKIVRELGSGGMGDVYEALDLELQQTVALKSIRPDIAAIDGVLSRFKKEVQLARRLSGPNVCRIHELFVIPGNVSKSAGAFLTMEFLDGVTLAEKTQRTGTVPWREAKAIANDMCAGLSAMHEAGIIHRDLKSRNVMLADRSGSRHAVLMDFGLAREVSIPSATATTALTAPGTFIGTPEYMAPEQFEGKDVSPATDIYAMGVVLYEMLTGKHPFAAPDALRAAVLRSKRPEPASSIQRGVPRRWDVVISKCLEYDPKRRYQSADELAGALRNPLQGISDLPKRASELSRRQVAGLALGLVLAGLAWFWWYKSTSYQAPDPRALKWYEQGIAALREGAYLQAVSELQEAVKLDQKFGMAHARLAEAWADLDFTGTAASEMLLATVPERERNLPDLDRRYIEAVRSTLLQDFGPAVQEFLFILHALPAEQKGYGYVDLGQAQEKAGNIQDAVKSYETAARLTPDNPAPFVHLGILKSRLQDPEGAEAAYSRAETLYSLKHNLEGLGEVAFQRGHWANERGDSALAKASLDQCTQIARQISSVQLQVRALTQLSNVDYYSYQLDDAIKEADRAIQLAQDNGLEYWVTDAQIRKGNAYVLMGNPGEAEKVSQLALSRAQKFHHAHLIANAQITLASIRDQLGKHDEQIQFAESALKYFQDYGMLTQASGATELIIRGQEGKDNYPQALESAIAMLALARKWNSPADIEAGDEAVGDILMDLERYPEALTHFEEALSISKSVHESVSYQPLHCAEALWRLGRYTEAESMLKSIPDSAARRADMASGIDLARAAMRLSQNRFGEAYSISVKALKGAAGILPGKAMSFEMVKVLAESELGHSQQAQQDAQELLASARKESDEGLIAQANLVQAAVFLRAGQPDQALLFAKPANQYFASKEETESEWLSLSYLAEIFRKQNNQSNAAENAKQAIDILNKLEQTWSPLVFKQYSSRPDIQSALRWLSDSKAR